MDLSATLTAHLAEPRTGWSVGSFGAIAEFHQDAGEATVVEGPLVRATARGAIRIETLDGVVPVAWEALSKRRDRWQQGVALCLPEARATMNRRTVLTELGPDANAVRDEDRGAILFDMGLAQANHDFCVRTANPTLIATLRAAEGRALAEPGNQAMGAILTAHPHRVAISARARVEVFQKIGGPDTGGVSPQGPHTHVLPKLMAAGRTHSANVAIPDGLMPTLMMHPASPVMDALGEDITFDADAHMAFQTMLAAWGAATHRAAKQAVATALAAGEAPGAEAATRSERAAMRIALRQAARTAPPSPVLAAWLAAHDGAAASADPDMPGH